MANDTRTPAEIVRDIRGYRMRGKSPWDDDELAAFDAVCGAWDREQARAQQVCGTCAEWRSRDSNTMGICETTVILRVETVLTPRGHSCAAYTPKETDRG